MTQIGKIDLYKFVQRIDDPVLDNEQYFFVAGDAFVPESEEDPYLFRRVLLLTEVDTEGKPYNLNNIFSANGAKFKAVDDVLDAEMYFNFQKAVESGQLTQEEEPQ